MSEKELDILRAKQEKINKSRKIVREILLNFIFVGILFTVIYSNLDKNKYYYQSQISSTFSGYSDVIFFRKILTQRQLF